MTTDAITTDGASSDQDSPRRRGYWLLALSSWLLAVGCWLSAVGCRSRDWFELGYFVGHALACPKGASEARSSPKGQEISCQPNEFSRELCARARSLHTRR